MTSSEYGPASSCAGVDTSKPSLSRVYDYLLGGGHNFAADRLLAERILAVVPDARSCGAPCCT
jgi:S-adenosyl methyltransferase